MAAINITSAGSSAEAGAPEVVPTEAATGAAEVEPAEAAAPPAETVAEVGPSEPPAKVIEMGDLESALDGGEGAAPGEFSSCLAAELAARGYSITPVVETPCAEIPAEVAAPSEAPEAVVA